MLQALVKRGRVVPVDIPAPLVSSETILVKTVNSCISAGTEISDVIRSGRSLISRALDQPSAIWKFLNMVRTEGLVSTVERITGQSDIGAPIGYSAAGLVLATGKDVAGLKAGDRVAVAGVGIANHAEFIEAPRNLSIRMADGLGFPAASTVALGGIAMQAIRRAGVHVGEFAVVYGVGTIGCLVLQMLIASGARAIAADIDPGRLEIAQRMGAELCVNAKETDISELVRHLTDGYGADVALYCSNASDPKALSVCASTLRRKGRIILVGAWSGGIERADVYSKELDVLMSTSYGPGRYDESYEKGGLDYPYAYVRWTERRNMQEYLRLVATGKIAVDNLIQAVYPIGRADEAFQLLRNPERPLFVLLDYGLELPSHLQQLAPPAPMAHRTNSLGRPLKRSAGKIRVGIIGAGRFATGMHLPNLVALSKWYKVRAVCSRTGFSAKAAAKSFEALYATTNYREILQDPEIDLVMICTRPALHAGLVIESLAAGKHTFVEKPLCTTPEDLRALDPLCRSLEGDPERAILMTGFNRRFSAYAREVKRCVSGNVNPLFLRYTMNAGYLSPGDMVYAEGGRLVGEACHVIDLLSFLVGSPVRSFATARLAPRTGSLRPEDNTSFALEYENGSLAAVDYFALGSPELPKERLEVHFDGKSIVVEDYRRISGFGVKVARLASPQPQKGHREELEALAIHILDRKPDWPISWDSMAETTQLSFSLAGS
jgi:predicted dehydrogenase/threonine dehydrogenase-like Zn-dependent dehydrogenase